jgi:hypothetical protein
MSAIHYQSTAQHTFRQAVIHLIENEYKLIGSHKVIQMIANDIADLHDEFYRDAPQVPPGHVVWHGTLDEGHKPPAGRRAEQEPTVTAILPLITPEDIAEAASGCPKGKNPNLWAHERDVRKVARLIQAGLENPSGRLLLSQAELSLLINRAIGTIRKCISDHFKLTGELLPTQGYVQDKGSKPTHKGIILRLYEKGIAPPDIARFTNHSLDAVDRYIKDYERVKILLNKGLNLTEISHAIGRGIRTVREYYKIVREIYPDQISPGQKES